MIHCIHFQEIKIFVQAKSNKKENGPDLRGRFRQQRRSKDAAAWLKVDLEAQLHDSRIARGTDRVEQRRGSVQRSAANGVGVIEGVERLPAQLASETLGELDVFEQGEISPPEAGTADGTRAACADRGLRGIGRGKGAGVEPGARSFRRAGIGITDQIRPAANGRSGKQATSASRVDASAAVAPKL